MAERGFRFGNPPLVATRILAGAKFRTRESNLQSRNAGVTVGVMVPSWSHRKRGPTYNVHSIILTEVYPHVQCPGPNWWLPVRRFSYVRSWSDTRQSAASTCNQVSPAEWMGWRDGRAGKYPLYFHRFTFILHSYYPWLKLQESRLYCKSTRFVRVRSARVRCCTWASFKMFCCSISSAWPFDRLFRILNGMIH